MPTFNEEKAIKKVVDDIKQNAKKYNTEILIVDSSKDKTPEIAKKLGVKVFLQPPQGHGVALKTAIKEAKNSIIITADCDDTYPMNYIPKLVDLITKEGYDMVSCNRLTKELNKEMPLINRFGNDLFAFLVRSFYGINVHDVSTGMFCMKREVKNGIELETNYSLPCEIILKTKQAGFKCKEINIPYKIRTGEVKLNRWRSGKAYLKCIFNYRFNLKINPKKL